MSITTLAATFLIGWQRPGRHSPRALLAALFTVTALGLAACGGGGDNNSGGGSGGGGGNGGNNSGGGSTVNTPTMQPIAPGAPNTVAVTVNSGVANVPNIPTVSVTVCAKGSSNCQVIDNVQVDTASFGLRVLASALGGLANAIPVNTTPTGATLAECTQFADGYTWGTVRTVDVKIAGETASAIPIQVIGDLASSTTPRACVNYGAAQNTQSDLGANGILGIGVAPTDCGALCQQNAATSNYYACPNGINCNNTTLAIKQQVANPVANFVTDNNGVILQMQPISGSGAPSASGTLVFGIGTQTNNAMAATQTLNTDQWGDLPSSQFNGSTLTAFLDSGSNGLFFNSSLPQCNSALAGFYCPGSPLGFSATLNSTTGTSATVGFNVVSAQTLLGNGVNFAANDLAGSFGSTANLDLGLPFFYGRYVYYGIDLTSTGGKAPYVAF